MIRIVDDAQTLQNLLACGQDPFVRIGSADRVRVSQIVSHAPGANGHAFTLTDGRTVTADDAIAECLGALYVDAVLTLTGRSKPVPIPDVQFHLTAPLYGSRFGIKPQSAGTVKSVRIYAGSSSALYNVTGAATTTQTEVYDGLPQLDGALEGAGVLSGVTQADADAGARAYFGLTHNYYGARIEFEDSRADWLSDFEVYAYDGGTDVPILTARNIDPRNVAGGVLDFKL